MSGKNPTSMPLSNCKSKEVLVLIAITQYNWLGESTLGSKVIMDPKRNLSNVSYDWKSQSAWQDTQSEIQPRGHLSPSFLLVINKANRTVPSSLRRHISKKRSSWRELNTVEQDCWKDFRDTICKEREYASQPKKRKSLIHLCKRTQMTSSSSLEYRGRKTWV